ncbi:MAG: triose-phosphate isomerase [Candidatus Niyogibacteria bacterium]|nr:MAG: triose-phosphate isomerase [Candidatus Niyogibacteria bacterium]
MKKYNTKKIIIANWKMNPQNSEQAASLFKKIVLGVKKSRKSKVVVAPPFVFLPALQKIGGLDLAAQDVFWKDEGAYTGEISPKMLKNVGVSYVIVGHSERREFLGETDEMINRKVKAALSAGLKTVLNFVKDELRSDLEGVSQRFAKNLIIAYEPLWAIGTGNAAEPDDIFEMATYIRRNIFDILGKKAAYETPILYGGSVDRKNAEAFLRARGVGGLLVGGASLLSKEFIDIVKSINV